MPRLPIYVVDYNDYKYDNGLYLSIDNWNDFGYNTLYDLICVINDEHIEIGPVKIAYPDIEINVFPLKKDKYREIPKDYFSLGQKESYYVNARRLSQEYGINVLERLNDIAFNEEIYNQVREYEVTNISLIRDLPVSLIESQFRRIAQGGKRFIKYEFDFVRDQSSSIYDDSVDRLHFFSDPEETPPSNIHIIIGRNGVGKTHLLVDMAKCLLLGKRQSKGYFQSRETQIDDEIFSNLTYVSFSAFDQAFKALLDEPDEIDDPIISHTYIGLKGIDENGNVYHKGTEDFTEDFRYYLREIIQNRDVATWHSVIENLKSDPILNNLSLDRFGDSFSKEHIDEIVGIFSELSSGHKIVLLTLAALVAQIVEKSLVILDEPETHLHPPLLSSFIRSLSEILKSANALAIIATHSPVVLQEAPSKCVKVLSRIGDNVKHRSPSIETFGENVGILTSEVFGLEVTKSGYFNILKSISQSPRDEKKLAQVQNSLGSEGLLILNNLLRSDK